MTVSDNQANWQFQIIRKIDNFKQPDKLTISNNQTNWQFHTTRQIDNFILPAKIGIFKQPDKQTISYCQTNWQFHTARQIARHYIYNDDDKKTTVGYNINIFTFWQSKIILHRKSWTNKHETVMMIFYI